MGVQVHQIPVFLLDRLAAIRALPMPEALDPEIIAPLKQFLPGQFKGGIASWTPGGYGHARQEALQPDQNSGPDSPKGGRIADYRLALPGFVRVYAIDD
jgi:hypothetical protein